MAKIKITKKQVDALQTDDKDQYFYDTELPGYGIKVTPKGRKVFFVQYWYQGRKRRYTIGPYGKVTPDQARRKAQSVLGRVSDGEDPQATRTAGTHGPTIAELSERYLREHARPKKKPKSLAQDERNIAKVVDPELGSRQINSINREDISRLHHKMRDTPYQANRILSLLSKMFNLAEQWGLRPDGTNPCRHVQKFRERKRERFLTDDEFSMLGATLKIAENDDSEMPSVIAAIRLLIFTGCRREEILTLKWEQVDFDRGVLDLPDETSKTGQRFVPLSKPALDVLRQTPRQVGNPYVCFGRNDLGHLVGLPKAWKRICSRAGIEGVRIHDLRHSFASVGVGAGMSLPVIGALLGHTQAATTQRYAHLAQSPLKQAADEVAEKIKNAMNKKPTTLF